MGFMFNLPTTSGHQLMTQVVLQLVYSKTKDRMSYSFMES